LAGETDIVYVISMHENAERQVPTPANLERWQDELNFAGDIMLLDYEREVIDGYIDANPGPRYTQAVTVFIDRHMRIRKVGATYENSDEDHAANLALLQQLLLEE